MSHLRIGLFLRSLQIILERCRRFQPLKFWQRSRGFVRQRLHSHCLILQRISSIKDEIPAKQIRKSYWHSCPKQSISWKRTSMIIVSASGFINLALQDNCHDDSINSYGFAKDNAVLVKINLTRFLERILGAFTAAPRILEPAINIPLGYLDSTTLHRLLRLLRRWRSPYRPKNRVRYCKRVLPSLYIGSWLFIKI